MPVDTMALVKTTRLKKRDSIYEIEIPQEFINKLDWRDGHVLEINEQDNRLIVEKLHGFIGK
jgi:bifunctional DNA-binding transcriptional regulator/antitoxin component of YhaV-PrlF toxin-antitoxin module